MILPILANIFLKVVYLVQAILRLLSLPLIW